MNSPIEKFIYKESHTEVVPQSVSLCRVPILMPTLPPGLMFVSTGSACSCESSVTNLSVKEDIDVIVADDPDVYYLEGSDVPWSLCEIS